MLNAILTVAEQGYKWRGLPKRFGRWHIVHTRMTRWANAGVLDRVFTALQEEEIIRIKVEALAVDSTIVKVHPYGTGAEKNGPRSIGRWRGGWTTKIHMAAADARRAVTLSLSPDQHHDAPAGRELMRRLPRAETQLARIMDRAYQGNETRQLALDLGFTPISHSSQRPCISVNGP